MQRSTYVHIYLCTPPHSTPLLLSLSIICTQIKISSQYEKYHLQTKLSSLLTCVICAHLPFIFVNMYIIMVDYTWLIHRVYARCHALKHGLKYGFRED